MQLRMHIRALDLNPRLLRPAKAIAAFCLLLASAAHAQQALSYNPADPQTGSPILFRVDLPEGRAVAGKWLGHNVTFTQSSDHTFWYLLAGSDVEQKPGTYPMEVTEIFNSGASRHLTTDVILTEASYRTAALRVSPRFIKPDAKTRAQVKVEQVVKEAAFARILPGALWSGEFAPPLSATPTDSFGTRRTFNGTVASVHKGADFRARVGTPVYASNDGVVTIAQPMFYEGNFVVLDHGQQLETLYMHLSRIDVKVGDTIKRGEQLGLSGATGRVDGPHLHFAVRWQGAYMDPVLLLQLPLPSR